MMGAGAAVVAAGTTALDASAKASHSGWLTSLAGADPRIDALRGVRSTRLAERAFGAADWTAVRSGPLHCGQDRSRDGEIAYYVPLAARDGSPTLLVLSHPSVDTAERQALRAAAARSGDAALFNDDIVVQLHTHAVPALHWATVDGRDLASRQVAGEQRSTIGDAASELTRRLAESAFAFTARLGPIGDAGAEIRQRRPLLLYRAAASGKASVRRCVA